MATLTRSGLIEGSEDKRQVPINRRYNDKQQIQANVLVSAVLNDKLSSAKIIKIGN